MAKELILSGKLTLSRNALDIVTAGTTAVDIAGKGGVKYGGTATETAAALDLGSIATPGFLLLRNLAAPSSHAPPVPIITFSNVYGPGGSTDYSYKLVEVYFNGAVSAASVATDITTGPSTLDNTSGVVLVTSVTSGVTHYKWYRTASAGTPSTTGLIADTGLVPDISDNGLAGDSSTPPSVAVGTVPDCILFGPNPDGSGSPIRIHGGEFALVRWNGSAIYVLGVGGSFDFEATIIED